VKLMHALLRHQQTTIVAEGYFVAILDALLAIQRRSRSAAVEGTCPGAYTFYLALRVDC
jgi:hypothetical protein